MSPYTSSSARKQAAACVEYSIQMFRRQSWLRQLCWRNNNDVCLRQTSFLFLASDRPRLCLFAAETDSEGSPQRFIIRFLTGKVSINPLPRHHCRPRRRLPHRRAHRQALLPTSLCQLRSSTGVSLQRRLGFNLICRLGYLFFSLATDLPQFH